MSNDNESIKMDKEGYAKFLRSIDEIKEKIKKNDMARSDAFNAGAGDGWDSPEYEEIERMSRVLNAELQDKYEMQRRIVIVEKSADDDIVDIGDVISVDINDKESIFKLVGGTGDFSAKIKEVSINSPVGKAVYKKKVGEAAAYEVKGKKNILVINRKIKLTDDEGPKTK